MISTSDRAGIFGRTGSGKTTLVRYLLRDVKRYAVIDPKAEFRMLGAVVRKKYDPRPDKVIYRAPMFGAGEMEWYDNIILRIFNEGKRLIVIDEAFFVTKSNPTSPGLARAMRMGRSKGVGVWACTQSPIRVPHELLSQTEHIIVFHLQDERDKERVTTMIGKHIRPLMARFEQAGHKHDFIYHNIPEHKTAYFTQPYGRKGLHAVKREQIA